MKWKFCLFHFICNSFSLTHPHVTFSSAFINSIKNNDTRKSAITYKLIIENTWQGILKENYCVRNNEGYLTMKSRSHLTLEHIRLAINEQHHVVQNYIPPFYGMEIFFIRAWYRHLHNVIIIRFSHRGKWELGFWAFGC